MAEFAITVVLKARDQASAAVRKMMRSARDAQRLLDDPSSLPGVRGSRNTRQKKQKGFLGLNGASIEETAGALTQLGGAARTAVGTPIALAANFEQAINRVNALSGGSLGVSGKLDKISKKARELGKTTEFTATQSAEAFAVLTQAGFSYEQQLASIGTVLDIATVAQIDMEKAANLTANALGGFNLRADEAGRVGEVLVRASNASQISIENLGESFKYAAPGATKLGFSIEEVGTAIAILGRSGLKGSMGGTALRAFFGRLSTLVDKDFATDKQMIAAKKLGLDRESLKKAIESGDLQNLATYMNDAMAKSKLSKTEKIASMQAIFQERGALGAQILMASAGLGPEVIGSWQQMEDAVNNTNITLEKSAAIMRGGTKGSATVLMSSLEELGITVGEKLLPVIKPLIEAATDSAVGFAKWADAHPTLLRMLGRSLIAVAALGSVLGPLLLTIKSVKTILSLTTIATGGFNRGLDSIRKKSPGAAGAVRGIGLAGGAAAAGVAMAALAVQAFEMRLSKLRAATQELGNSVMKNESELASSLSDEELAARTDRLMALSTAERERVTARQAALDNEWYGAKSTILGAFGGSELNTVDESTARTLEQQYQTLADERKRREEEKKIAPTLAGAGAKKGADVTGAITVVIDSRGDQQVRVGKIEEGDVPLKVDLGGFFEGSH